MDKRVDKGEDFRKSGMTLITEIDSERYLRKAKKAQGCQRGRNLRQPGRVGRRILR